MRKVISVIALYFICYSLHAQIVSNMEKKAEDILLSKAEDIAMVQPILPCDCEDKSSVDLSPLMPPVQQQQGYNDCVGWALGYACRSYYHKMNSHVDFYKGGKLDSSNLISPYFLFNSLWISPQQGINLKKALDFLRDHGSCTWDMLDSVAEVSRPTEAQQKEAIEKGMQVYTYYRLNYDNGVSMDEIKSALKCGDPVVVALTDDEDYFTPAYRGASFSLWDKVSKNINGSHAVVIVGYDNVKKRLKFMNSYGESWADKGYGYISYSIAESVILEAYVIKAKAPFYRIDLPSMGRATHYKPGYEFPKANPNSQANEAPRTQDIPINDLIPQDAQLRIDTLTHTGIKLSISISGNQPHLNSFLEDNLTKVYIRLFTVATDGTARPLISKDSLNRLGNGQVAFKSALTSESWALVNVFSVNIPVLKLNINKETEKQDSHSNQPAITKLRADAVFYHGREPVAVSKPVDFIVEQ